MTAETSIPSSFSSYTPDKQIYNCDYTYAYDLRKGSFNEYFNGQDFKDYVRKSETCNRCVRTCVRGYSYTYNLWPRQIWGLAEEARNLFNKPSIAGNEDLQARMEFAIKQGVNAQKRTN